MGNRHFDENEFQYALDRIDRNPYESIILFKDYLKRYPTDYYARAYYIILLERLNKINEAKEEFRKVSNESVHDYSFNKNAKRKRAFQCIMALAKAKILAASERYQDLLDYYNKNIDLFDQRDDTKYLVYYCKAKLGLINKKDIVNGPYRFMQVIDYNENRFIEHITKHLSGYNIDSENPNKYIFVPEFPIEKIITEVKKYIPSDKRLCPGLFDNAYYFKYDNCGRSNGKMTNYFKVICFHNTNDLLTMCPTTIIDNVEIEDLNYLQYQDDCKVKKLSQIDKFNKRFNRS